MLAWFSLDPFHSAPTALSIADNLALQLHLNSSYSIFTYNHPLPKTTSKQISDLLSSDVSSHVLLVLPHYIYHINTFEHRLVVCLNSLSLSLPHLLHLSSSIILL